MALRDHHHTRLQPGGRDACRHPQKQRRRADMNVISMKEALERISATCKHTKAANDGPRSTLLDEIGAVAAKALTVESFAQTDQIARIIDPEAHDEFNAAVKTGDRQTKLRLADRLRRSRQKADTIIAACLSGDIPITTPGTTLYSVIADIREKSGVGVRPMLSELADAIKARIESQNGFGRDGISPSLRGDLKEHAKRLREVSARLIDLADCAHDAADILAAANALEDLFTTCLHTGNLVPSQTGNTTSQMNGIIANHNPNNEYGSSIVEVVLKVWGYAKTISVPVRGNLRGFNVIEAAIERIYDDLSAAGDPPSITLVNDRGETLRCEEAEERWRDVEWVKSMVVSATITGYIQPTVNEVRARNRAAPLPDGDIPYEPLGHDLA